MSAISFLINAIAGPLNIAIYADSGNPVNLGIGVACCLFALAVPIWDITGKIK